VFYDPDHRAWAIVSQDGSPILEGTAFNVHVGSPLSDDTGDLVIDGIEVTQSIQRYPENSIPLLGYKRTAVRVYLHGTPGVLGPWASVSGRLAVLNRSGTHAGGPITNRLINPVNGTAGVITAATSDTGRGMLGQSLLFELDVDQTAPGERRLEVAVFPTSPRGEPRLENNRRSIDVTFTQPIDVTLYGARWANGTSGLQAAPFSDFDAHRRVAQNMLPVSNLSIIPLPGDPAPTFYDTDGSIEIGGSRYTIAAGSVFDRGGDLLVVGNDVCITNPVAAGRISGSGSVTRDRAPGAICGAIARYSPWDGAYVNAHNAINRTFDMASLTNQTGVILQPESECNCGWCCSVTTRGNWILRAQNRRGDNTGLVIAHELGHRWGRDHTNSVEHRVDDGTPDYPYPHASIGPQFGIRFAGNDGSGPISIVPGATPPAEHVHDVMSYAFPQWISPFTYCKVLENLSGGAIACDATTQRAQLASPYALVRMPLPQPKTNFTPKKPFVEMVIQIGGTIAPDGTAAFLPFEIVEAPVVKERDSGKRYRVALEDAAGRELERQHFDIVSHDDAKGRLPFSVTLPWRKETKRIVLYDLKNAIAVRRVSRNAPKIQADFGRIATAKAPIAKSQKLSWRAMDADGDAIRYSVQYSVDGSRWMAVATLVDKPSATIDFGALPGSDAALLRVIATDGVNTSVAVSPQFSVARKKPQVRVAITGGVAEATAFDWEDGAIVDPARFRWSIDGIDQGNGHWLVLANRAKPGRHIVAVSVADDDKNVSTASAEITQ
jgi:hypothetical protein